MTPKRFHIVLAAVLVICIICPYVETALDWNQSIFDTGYDTESTVAVIALLLVLAFGLAKLIVDIIPKLQADEKLRAEPRVHILSSSVTQSFASSENLFNFESLSTPALAPLRI